MLSQQFLCLKAKNNIEIPTRTGFLKINYVSRCTSTILNTRNSEEIKKNKILNYFSTGAENVINLGITYIN